MRAWLATLVVWFGVQARAEERVGPGGLRYDLVPAKGASAEQPRDLLIGLHGKGSTKDKFAGWVNPLLPALAESHRVWVQSPTDHWQRDAIPPLAELAARLRRELPVRHVILFGFSAGGFAATGCLFEHPAAFDAALIGGATWWGRPGNEEAKRRPVYWSVGENDGVVNKNGGPDHLRRALGEIGYPEERWQIEVVPGMEHSLDGASLGRGLTFLKDKLAQDDALRPEDRAALEALANTIKDKAGTPEALSAAAEPLLAARRREVTREVAQALVPLLKDPAGPRGLAALALAARARAPLLGEPLVKAWGKVKKDEAAALAWVGALDALEAGAGLPGLAGVLDGWDLEGKVQLAAAETLGQGGSPAAIDPLLGALKAAEKKRRADYARALETALKAITGKEGVSGAEAWLRALRPGR